MWGRENTSCGSSCWSHEEKSVSVCRRLSRCLDLGFRGFWAEEGPSVDRPLEWTETELEEWAEEVAGDTGSGRDGSIISLAARLTNLGSEVLDENHVTYASNGPCVKFASPLEGVRGCFETRYKAK
ncbi:hypothetical protein Tco_0526912 [Tanacetum coccineum]